MHKKDEAKLQKSNNYYIHLKSSILHNFTDVQTRNKLMNTVHLLNGSNKSRLAFHFYTFSPDHTYNTLLQISYTHLR